jgi:hypothetical protein
VGSNPTFSASKKASRKLIIIKKVGFERADKENATYGSIFPPRRDSEPKAKRSESHLLRQSKSFKEAYNN